MITNESDLVVKAVIVGVHLFSEVPFGARTFRHSHLKGEGDLLSANWLQLFSVIT